MASKYLIRKSNLVNDHIATKYLLKEVIPQFLSTLIILCSLMVVSQLVRLSDVLVTFGLSPENILLPFLYIIVPFLPIILPISFLFSAMMSFSRMSTDGEIIALLASGLSLKKMYRSQFGLSILLCGVGFFCSVYLEAWGRREFVQFIYRKTQTEVDNMVRFKIRPGIFLNDFLNYVFYTEEIKDDRRTYHNVMLAPREKKQGDFVLLAPEAKILGSVEEANLRMTLYDGVSYSIAPEEKTGSTLKFAEAEIDILRVFQDRILGADSKQDDYRSFTPSALKDHIDELRDNGSDPDELLKATFLYYSRMANCLTILVFGVLGMILGITDQRQAKSNSYFAGISAVILCFLILITFRWLAENRYLSIPVAIALPHVLLLAFAGFCLYQKDRLPLSESIFARRNLPFAKHPE